MIGNGRMMMTMMNDAPAFSSRGYITDCWQKPKRILFLTQACVEKRMMSKDVYFKAMRRYITDLVRLWRESVHCFEDAEYGGHDVYQIIIKLHPSEKHINEYKKILHDLKADEDLLIPVGSVKTSYLNLKPIQIIQQHDNLSELIDGSDIVIGFKSSTLIQAMLLNKPVVSVELYDIAELSEYLPVAEFNKVLFRLRIDDDIGKAIEFLIWDDYLLQDITREQHKFAVWWYGG